MLVIIAAAFKAAIAIFWRSLGSAGFSLLITAAQKTGVINELDAAGIKFAHDATSAVLALKAYQQFPAGKNGQ
jgi:hypothetical protein